MNNEIFFEEKHELSWEEQWEIIEDMTSNMDDAEREDWIESLE